MRPGEFRGAVAFFAPLVLFALLYTGVAWLVGRQVPAQTSVAGVHIGGMTPSDARARLRAKLGDLQREPVTLDLAGTAVEATPAQLGLSLDLDGTLDGVTGFSLDPRHVWFGLTGGGPVPPRGTIDESVAAPRLADYAARVDRPVTQARIELGAGAVQAVPPQQGLQLDVPGTVSALQETWPGSSPVEAVITRTAPEVSTPAYEEGLDIARSALAAPLVVVHSGAETTLPVADVAPALRMDPDSGRLVLRADGGVLGRLLRARIGGLESGAVDATVRLTSGRPTVVPAVPARALDEAVTAERVAAALTPSGGSPATRRAGVVTRLVPASVDTEQARAWGVTHRLAQVAVPDVVAGLGEEPAQRANVAAGAAALSGDGGRVLRARESVSLSRVIGDHAGLPVAPEPPADPGAAQPAPGVERVPGGGLSQLATALYAAGWNAGLDLGARRAHAVHLPAYPRGLDAVYRWPGADVTLTNPGPGAVLVHAQVDSGRLVVSVWGRRDTAVRSTITPPADARPAPSTPPAGDAGCTEKPMSANGFTVEARREAVRGRTVMPSLRETVTYRPWRPPVCAPAATGPAPTPTPPTSPAPTPAPTPTSPTAALSAEG